MDSIDIRPFEPQDRTALLALVRALQAAEVALYDRMKPPEQIGEWYVDYLLDACHKHGGQILVADDGNSLLGYAAVLIKVSSEDEIDEVPYLYALVRDLAVAEAARGRGIGSRLLQRGEELARAAGVRWLRLGVLAGNAAAVRVYDKAGFKPLSMTMEKPLAD